MEAPSPCPPRASPPTPSPALPASIDAALRALLRDVVRDVVREELAGLTAPAVAPPPPGLPLYLTAEQAAEIAGVAEKTVRGWVRAGKLRGHWAGRLLRIERTDLEHFMRTGVTTPGESGDVDGLAARILGRRRKG